MLEVMLVGDHVSVDVLQFEDPLSHVSPLRLCPAIVLQGLDHLVMEPDQGLLGRRDVVEGGLTSAALKV